MDGCTMRTYHVLKHVDGKDCESSCSSAAPGQSRSVGREGDDLWTREVASGEKTPGVAAVSRLFGHGGVNMDNLMEVLRPISSW